MALEDYTLVSIRTRLAEEFGVDIVNQTENADIIDKRINDAIAWVVNRRKNWPWMEKEASLDVGELSTSITNPRYGAAIFYKMQRQATNAVFSQTALAAREFVDFDGKGHDGIMATAITAGTTITLEHAYMDSSQICTITTITAGNPTTIKVSLAASDDASVTIPANVSTFPVIITGATGTGTQPNGTHSATRTGSDTFTVPVNTTGSTFATNGTAQVGREFTIAQSFFALPQDFVRSDAAHTDIDTNWNTLVFRNTTSFEREIKADRVVSDLNRIYTVLPDPINVDDTKYLAVFPYFTGRNVIHVKYFGDARKLVGDNDVPDVPRSDRFVLWYAAAWFVAQWQRDTDMVTFYKDSALTELERMAKEYQLADDISEDYPSTTDSLPDLPQATGFPEFDVD